MEFWKSAYLIICQYSPKNTSIAVIVRQEDFMFLEYPQHPIELGISEPMIVNSVMVAKEERNIYKQFTPRSKDTVHIDKGIGIILNVFEDGVAIYSFIGIRFYARIANIINNIRTIIITNVCAYYHCVRVSRQF
jgi:hypothetical protein